MMRKNVDRCITYFKTRVKLDEETGCLEWTGGISSNGAGNIYIAGVYSGTAYEWIDDFINGPLPDGYERHHRCRNRKCVNVFHIQRLTVAEHHRIDIIARGNTCPYGHPYTEDNIAQHGLKRGAIICKTCEAERALKRYRKRKEVLRRFKMRKLGKVQTEKADDA